MFLSSIAYCDINNMFNPLIPWSFQDYNADTLSGMTTSQIIAISTGLTPTPDLTNYIQRSDSPTITGSWYKTVNPFILHKNGLASASISSKDSSQLQFTVSASSLASTAGTTVLSRTMTGYSTPAPSIVSASSSLSGGWEAWNAFDGVNSGPYQAWLSNNQTPCWIQYNHASAITSNSYTIIPRWNEETSRCPKDWTIWGSNDGVNFSTLTTVSNQTGWSVNGSRRFTFTNETGYQYYRMNISATNGDNYCTIGEIQYTYDTLGFAGTQESTFTLQAVGIGNALTPVKTLRLTQEGTVLIDVNNSSITIKVPLYAPSYLDSTTGLPYAPSIFSSPVQVNSTMTIANQSGLPTTLRLENTADSSHYLITSNCGFQVRGDNYVEMQSINVPSTAYLSGTVWLGNDAGFRWNNTAAFQFRTAGSDSMQIGLEVNSPTSSGYLHLVPWSQLGTVLTSEVVYNPTFGVWNNDVSKYLYMSSSQTYANFETNHSTFNFNKSINVQGNLNVTGRTFINMPYASFYSTTTQTIAVINTTQTISLDGTFETHGDITREATGCITTTRKGAYLFTFSVLPTGDVTKTLHIFPRINDVNVANSNTPWTFAANSTVKVETVTYLFEMNAGDKFCLIMYSDDVDTKLNAYVASTTPIAPASPSIILTVQKIGEVQ